jgi:DNA modification methylase
MISCAPYWKGKMLKTIPIAQITDRVEVRRIKPGGVQRLRAKIEKLGYLPQYPLLVVKARKGYTLVDGAHRLEALKALGIKSAPVYVDETLAGDAEHLRRARQANEAAESVIPTTFVDDAELVWRETARGRAQDEIAAILGWTGTGARVRVAQYKALQKIASPAWARIVTTFDPVVTPDDDEVVTEDVTTVTLFSERLLRSIVDLSPDQQLTLVADLAEGRIKKAQFKAVAQAYEARNEMKACAQNELAGVDAQFVDKALAEFDRGAYDKDWQTEGHPRLTRLIQTIRDEWEQKVGVQVVLGDFEVRVRDIADGSVDLVLTDPPYNISKQGKLVKTGVEFVPADFDGDQEWDSATQTEFLARLEKWVSEWARVTRPGGAVISFCDKILVSDLWRLYQQAGLVPKNVIVWEKTNISPTGLVRRNLKSSAEFMVWAVKPGADYAFNETEGWDRGIIMRAPICGGHERVKDEKGNTLHPTQKPEQVMLWLIEVFSNRGDVVLDGFAGVGSTGAAARRVGRKFIGIENNARYLEAMRIRLG